VERQTNRQGSIAKGAIMAKHTEGIMSKPDKGASVTPADLGLSVEEYREILNYGMSKYPDYDVRIVRLDFTRGELQAKTRKPNMIIPSWFHVGYCDDIMRKLHMEQKDLAPSNQYIPDTEINRLRSVNAALVEALESAQKVIASARKYFPKSMHNSDKFDMELACAEINKALAKAKGE
jgi:hypothetical protein